MVFPVLVKLQASVLLIILIFASTPTLLLSATTPSRYNFTIAKPDCIDRCGDISIPYPFGTKKECYQSPPFLVTCNNTHFDSPKLFRLNGTTEMRDISLDGQVTILEFVGLQCYAPNGSITSRNKPYRKLVEYFTVNNTANKFTMVGCNAEAVVSGLRHNGRQFITGCRAVCQAEADLMEGSCRGLGCCQTSIPKNVQSVEVQLMDRSSNNSDVWNFNDCSYAFVVEESSFTFSLEYFTKLENVPNLPMVLDWAIGNGTCEEAKKNSTCACLSLNSDCYEPENGYGYRCRCNGGYEGNPYLRDGCQDINECENATHNCTKPEYCENTNGSYTCSCPKGHRRGPNGCSKKQLDMKIVLIAIAFGIIALLLAAILYMELRTRRSQRMKKKFFLENGGIQIQEKLPGRAGSPDLPRRFSSSELQKATNDFHNNMIIGQGGFGTVYKGFLPDNRGNSRTVAIKKSKKVNSNQIEQFINEMSVLSQLNHRNVVRFLGCCLETEVPLLVSEFISNGTLYAHIHDRARARFFKWDLRLKIAVEIASVLSYLHSEASTPIIHGDVKSNKILLDHTFTAKVSDFGASKLVPLDITQLPTMVQGTLGYLDPEYMQTNKLTEKSDVYSFGVILLELLTARTAMSSDNPEEGQSLASFFILNQDHLLEILDKNIASDKNMEQISEVAKLAKWCLNVKGEDRPSMKVVETKLQVLIQGREHPWDISEDNAEVTDQYSLLGNGKGVEFNSFANGEGTSASVEYDRLGYDSLTANGGR